MLTTFYNHVTEAMRQENLKLEEVARILNKHGIYGVEADYKDLNRDGKGFDFELVKRLAAVGLPVYGVYVFYDWGYETDDQSYRHIYEELAAAGIHNSLAVPGFIQTIAKPAAEDAETATERMIVKLKEAVEYADSLGIRILLEDFDDKAAPFSTAAGMLRFFNAVPKLKCAFDTGNFFYSGEDALEKLPLFTDKIAYVHCKDRSLEAKPGENPKMSVKGDDMYSSAAGEGLIPFEQIIDRLKEAGYKGDYAVEDFGSQNMLRDLIASADFLNSLI